MPLHHEHHLSHDSIPNDIWEQICQVVPHTAIAVIAKDGSFLWSNNEYSKMTGYAPHELRELTWKDITVTKDVGGDQAAIDEILRGIRQSYYVTKEYCRKDGSIILVDIYVHSYPIWSKETILLISTAKERSSDEVLIESLEKQLESIRKDIAVFKGDIIILQNIDDVRKGFYKYLSGTIWPWVLLASSFIAFVISSALTIYKLVNGG